MNQKEIISQDAERVRQQIQEAGYAEFAKWDQMRAAKQDEIEGLEKRETQVRSNLRQLEDKIKTSSTEFAKRQQMHDWLVHEDKEMVSAREQFQRNAKALLAEV